MNSLTTRLGSSKKLILARSNLDNLLIRAPRAGRLPSLAAELGESKGRGERLGQIDDVDRFKAVAFVNEFYLLASYVSIVQHPASHCIFLRHSISFFDTAETWIFVLAAFASLGIFCWVAAGGRHVNELATAGSGLK